jgi:ferredoxin
MGKKVRVDKDACIGCGLCVSIAPAVFDWDDDGKIKTLVDEVPEGEEAAVDEAVASCPTAAITVE